MPIYPGIGQMKNTVAKLRWSEACLFVDEGRKRYFPIMVRLLILNDLVLCGRLGLIKILLVDSHVQKQAE